MKIGLIDLGSNTIKLEIFEIAGLDFKSVFYDATYAYVIDDIKEGKLTLFGIEKIVGILDQYRKMAQEHHCKELFCFSTASLRKIENQQQVLDSVYSACGVEIIPISGQEEAYYNFLSMSRVAGETFIGGDMGGGSMQLFRSENGSLQKERSFPLGALKLYQKFVSGMFPTVEEAAQIQTYVKDQIHSGGFSPQKDGADILYFMGGSTRVISSFFPNGTNLFSVSQLRNRLDLFLADPLKAKQQIERICPQRMKTILPAMAALLGVCDFFHITEVCYTQCSVREGYLIHQFNLNRKECS